MDRVEVTIVGGGITGVSVGRLLQRAGLTNFVILEKAEQPGGLCRSQFIHGHTLDVGGGHLLCSKYPEVYDFIFEHLPRSEFNSFERVSKIALAGRLIDYPLEYNLWQLPIEQRAVYLISCIRAAESDGQRTPAHFEEWVRNRLGEAIADDYMIPYNSKIWGVEPNELATDWLEKIPRYDLLQIVRACLDQSHDRSVLPSHQSFLYPKRGGFQAIFDAILRPIADKVRLSTPLTSLRRAGGDWIVNERYRTRSVVSTIPWPVVHAATFDGPAVDDEMRCLQTSSLVVTLHEEEYDTDSHWTYVPDPALAHHREFYIRNFVPDSAPNGIFRETNARHFKGAPGALAVCYNEHAYPIPLKGHAEAAGAVWKAYADLGVIGIGRWGQHRYYNSDVCIREALRMVSGYAKNGVRGAAEAMMDSASRVLS